MVVRWRFVVGALWLASLAMSVHSAQGIESRFQFRDFYDYAGNPDIEVLRRYHTDFGDPAGNVIVLLEADDVFQPQILNYIDDLTHNLEPYPVFRRVRSMTNARVMHGHDDEVVGGVLFD